jgi:hypothetical protein
MLSTIIYENSSEDSEDSGVVKELRFLADVFSLEA